MKLMLFGLMLFISISCVAQKSQIDSFPQVTVSDWGKKTFAVSEIFWAQVKDELIKQVGEDQFNKIKIFSENRNKPKALLIWDGNAKVASDEWRKRMNSLALYEVATATRMVNGERVKSTFLLVPYQELYWDKNAKWDAIYFIIKGDKIVQRKNENN